jgi:tetratricopeptide (TPR) repeat protein
LRATERTEAIEPAHTLSVEFRTSQTERLGLGRHRRRRWLWLGVGAGVFLGAGVLAAWVALQEPEPRATPISASEASLPQMRPAPTMIDLAEPADPAKSEPEATEPSSVGVTQPKSTEARRSREKKPRAESGDDGATRPSRAANRESAKPAASSKPAAAPMLSANDLVQAAARELIQGHLSAASDLYSQAARLDPKSEAAYRGLGLTYERLGKKSDAIRALNRALALAPNGQNAAMLKARLERLQGSQ